jgi:hypothetical protein
MESTVKVSTKLELNDLMDFNKSLVYGKPSTKIFIAISIILLIFSGFGIAARFMGDANIPSANYFTFVLSFIYLFIMPIILKYATKKIFNINQVSEKLQQYEIDEENIVISTESGSQKISYNEIMKVVETKRDFQFFVEKYQAYLIPKRCFEDESDIQKLREIIIKNVPKSKFVEK